MSGGYHVVPLEFEMDNKDDEDNHRFHVPSHTVPIFSIVFTVLCIVYSLQYRKDFRHRTIQTFYDKWHNKASPLQKCFYSMLGIGRFQECTAWLFTYRLCVLVFGQFIAMAIIEIYLGKVVWLVVLFMIFIFHLTNAEVTNIIWNQWKPLPYCCGSFVHLATMTLSLFVLHYHVPTPDIRWVRYLIVAYKGFVVGNILYSCISDMIRAIQIRNASYFFFWHFLNVVYACAIGLLLYWHWGKNAQCNKNL